MPKILVDAELVGKLRQCLQPVELVDAAGQLLGTFRPHIDEEQWKQIGPRISEEELDRRQREGGVQSLEEILHSCPPCGIDALPRIR